MRLMRFADAASECNVLMLIKASAFNQYELEQYYVTPLVDKGITRESIVALPLPYQNGKASARLIKEVLSTYLSVVDSLNPKVIYCADSNYFKVLAKERKAEPHLGYVLEAKAEGYEGRSLILGINHHALIYNPASETKLNQSLDCLAGYLTQNYSEPGKDILKDVSYPNTYATILEALRSLKDKPYLAADIEAFSLRKTEAGIGTIAFAWDQHSGIAFPCDYAPISFGENLQIHGEFRPNEQIRTLLREFFKAYKGEIRWHRANYDIGVIIYTLWMKHPTDYAGLLEGLEVMTKPGQWHDTRLIAYLALNNTGRADLSLKSLAQSHAGNWAQDEINDIRRIPLDTLLQYNLVDAVSTNYVYDTYYPKMVADCQEKLYKELFIPAQKTIIQMELVGMPMNPQKIRDLRKFLEHLHVKCLTDIRKHPLFQEAEYRLRCQLAAKYNETHVKKQKTPEDYNDETINLNSTQQLSLLLYDVLNLPVLDYTDSGQPSTGSKTLEKILKTLPEEGETTELLKAILLHSKVSKILSAFLPHFENAVQVSDDLVLLQGSFNLGGTVSGRMSSSDPNLQNIPAGSEFGKAVKECFIAPEGWVFCGADFNSLEDYISALTTKDPNKLKVYLEGYDGHCLRAYNYFRDQMPDIMDTVESINSIKDKYPKLRSKSKGPTFALTYRGTWLTLVTSLGFSEEEAKRIEREYHELYKVSDEYVMQRLEQARKDGYVEVAFGLRVRTPLLSRSLEPISEAKGLIAKEGRTAGNALGQSYGLLTNRAMNAFMEKVWAHPKMRLSVMPVAMIHDALYFLIRNDLEVAHWVNTHLIQEMRWQELPEIQHDKVKLGAALDIFYPSWAHPLTLPNDASKEEIRQLATEHLKKLETKEKEAA